VDSIESVSGDIYLVESAAPALRVGEALSICDAFRVGDALLAYTPSTGVLGSDVYTVVSATSGNIEIDTGGSAPPAVGDVLIVSPPLSGSTGASADGFELEDYAGHIGSTGRWR
jgi:hypothetical protein